MEGISKDFKYSCFSSSLNDYYVCFLILLNLLVFFFFKSFSRIFGDLWCFLVPYHLFHFVVFSPLPPLDEAWCELCQALLVCTRWPKEVVTLDFAY